MDIAWYVAVITVFQKNPGQWLLWDDVFKKSGLYEKYGYSKKNYEKLFDIIKYWVKLKQVEERQLGRNYEFKYNGKTIN